MPTGSIFYTPFFFLVTSFFVIQLLIVIVLQTWSFFVEFTASLQVIEEKWAASACKWPCDIITLTPTHRHTFLSFSFILGDISLGIFFMQEYKADINHKDITLYPFKSLVVEKSIIFSDIRSHFPAQTRHFTYFFYYVGLTSEGFLFAYLFFLSLFSSNYFFYLFLSFLLIKDFYPLIKQK